MTDNAQTEPHAEDTDLSTATKALTAVDGTVAKLQRRLDAMLAEQRLQVERAERQHEDFQHRLNQVAESARTAALLEQVAAQRALTAERALAQSRKSGDDTQQTKRWRKEIRSFHDLLYKVELKDGLSVDLAELPGICLERARPVTQPLVLISQVPRSGGTLLNELFDSHPECHVHPHELYLGHLEKHAWPELNLHDRPERWFDILFEWPVVRLYREGYRKYSTGADDSSDVFRFLFLPSVQKQIFLKCISATPSPTLRDIYNAYMTAFFNAWLDNQNMSGEKKAVVGFVPGLSQEAVYVDRFLSAYPDGHLISVLRDPKTWYVSARQHWSDKAQGSASLEDALERWAESARGMLRNKATHGDRVCLLGFDDLLRRTEPVMRHLADVIGLTFDPILLKPTFNRFPKKANSSFPTATYGVQSAPTMRAEALTPDELTRIDALTGDIYSEALRAIWRPD